VSDIIKKMSEEMPETFFRFNILLAANMAIAAHYSSSAIQAVPVLSFRGVAHDKFLLK
jgi:hypothetical protein